MAYVSTEARQELLDTVAEAADRLADALAAVGDAYEQLDEHAADALEAELFRPLQTAYGRAKSTHAGFAARHGHPAADFVPKAPGGAPADVRDLLEAAAEATEHAEDILTELQDSMSPVEVGDPELRAGLADVRTVLDGLAGRAERFIGRIGR